jgi:hypothetical protein
MKLKPSAIALVSAIVWASSAQATTLTFEDLAEGATLSNQYAAQGAVFSPNAFSGAGGPFGDWATNTNMTITATDLGGLGTPAGLVSGKVLHSFGGWLNEDGDPSFKITFSGLGANTVFAAFAGVSTPANVHLYAYKGATLIGDVTSAVTTGQFVLSFAAASITSVVITPGSFNDWVGVDNITYTLAAVPEPETVALMALGLGFVGGVARRRSQKAAQA